MTTWKRAHHELERIAKARARLDHEEGRWLLVAWRERAHAELGFGSFAEYVERLLGHSPRATAERLRVAEALERLPALDAALQHNTLGWSAVRELTRVATPATEADWLAAAEGLSARDIERLVSGRAPGDRPTDAARDEARRHRLSFDVSADTLATFRQAVAALRRSSGSPLDDDATLLLLARHVLGGPADAGRASYQIEMTVCERCGAGAQLGKGEAVPVTPEVVEMARCDAQCIQPGTRAAQTIPPATRREVMRRHHGACAVPGCRNAVFVDLHHVEPRAEGGSHDPEKLVALCSAHHRALHRGQLLIEGSASTGFSFRHADGSAYGAPRSPQAAASTSRAFRALTSLGYKEREARRAIESVPTHVGMGDEALLRAALRTLSESALRVSDPRRPTWVRRHRDAFGLAKREQSEVGVCEKLRPQCMEPAAPRIQFLTSDSGYLVASGLLQQFQGVRDSISIRPADEAGGDRVGLQPPTARLHTSDAPTLFFCALHQFVEMRAI